VVLHFPQARPRRDGRLEKCFCLPFVAYSGNERLVEESVAELTSLICVAKALEHGFEVRRVVHHVRPQASDPRRPYLENRSVSLHGLPRPGTENEPGPAENRPAHRLHEPASAHAQMTADDEAAFERQEQILAARLDAFETPAVDALGDSEHGGTWMGRLGLDDQTLQHLEPLGGAVQAVTLGHGSFRVSARPVVGPRGTRLPGEAA
jgi:hypothetical protein